MENYYMCIEKSSDNIIPNNLGQKAIFKKSALWTKGRDITIAFNETGSNLIERPVYNGYDRDPIQDIIQSRSCKLTAAEIVKKVIIERFQPLVNLNFKFINAANFTRLFSSCTLLIYKLFKSSVDINNYQKNLLILIDDYDSYKLSFSKTKNLNILFWAHYYNNVPLFLSDFNDGFNQFNSLQNKIINIQKQKISDTIKNLKPFYTKTKIQNIECNVVAAFADTAINDVSDYLLQQYNADVSIVVNLKSDRVSFRRKNTAIDLSILAKKLCNGGGHEAAAGGKITEIFLEFTKIFSET